MFTRAETLRYVGRFSLVFASIVFLMGRHYANLGLVSISAGVAIIGLLCLSDSIRHSVADAAPRLVRRSRPVAVRPSGEFR